MKDSQLTPMMRQYLEIKGQHKDAVLFFRLGDFYEMFHEDAAEVSGILNITLTKRHGIPMCGIPYHASENYIGRLLNAGKKIAICEQTSIPQKGKGIAERKVVEIISPGTVLNENYLDSNVNNYLASLGGYKDKVALAYVDVSTGDFSVMSFSREDMMRHIRKEIFRINPREIIVQDAIIRVCPELKRLLDDKSVVQNIFPDWDFDVESSYRKLCSFYDVHSLKGFGFNKNSVEIGPVSAIIDYLTENSIPIKKHLQKIEIIRDEKFVSLDESTQKNLEILMNLQDNSSHFSLLSVLDLTKTPMGSRLLRNWIVRPLRNKEEIEYRLDKVTGLYEKQELLNHIRKYLSDIHDTERLSSRIATDRAHAKDLLSIKNSLICFSELRSWLIENKAPMFTALNDSELLQMTDIIHFIESSIREEPSLLISEGKIIKNGYNAELDNLHTYSTDSRDILDKYLSRIKLETGITSLRIKKNKIIGYYLEVSKSNLDMVPGFFQRKQSLVNGERFTTNELNDIEVNLNSFSERIIELEKRLFLEIREKIRFNVELLYKISRNIAELDLFHSFAYCATLYGYTRPALYEDNRLIIKEGRHPVVERFIDGGNFIPNDVSIMNEDQRFIMLTGPNMAGKSTYLRQIALITFMAQLGCFIPANYAEIGLVDKIFCRVGASDNLARGESTFLVEMNETANILRNASDMSLIIMDEVGRGTSTNDGLAIAWAISEYLMDEINGRTFFATHYHELTDIKNDKMTNYSMAVEEGRGKIFFLKKVQKGPSANSYGLHVAKLAGLPEKTLKRASVLLHNLPDSVVDINNSPIEAFQEEQLFRDEDLILEEIKAMDINNVSPMDALNKLLYFQNILKNN